MKYVIFLRGINVGGIRVPMAELKECLSRLPVTDIKTFLQTGNVVCKSELFIAPLKDKVEHALSEKFNYTAHVLIYPEATLAGIISDYPFLKDELKHSYILFCQSQTIADELISHKNSLDKDIEDIAQGNSVIYWTVLKGSTTNTFFSKIIAKPKYKSVTTNRNINTLQKMIL